MFQFTREFIINNNDGKLTGNKRFVGDGTNHVLKVDHMINLKAADVTCGYKSEGHAAVNEVIAIKPTVTGTDVLAVGDVVRLVLVLGQEGRVISTYNDYYPNHSRTFIYEARVATADTIPTAALVAAMAEEAARFENPFFTASESTGVITLTAPDCYTRFNEVRVVKVPATSEDLQGNILTGYLDYEVLYAKDRAGILALTGDESITKGDLGKGTTNYIVQNMRLQTAANLNPYGVNMDERPLPQSVYDQYTFELVTERRHIGHQVMGAIDNSLVTVIFFVLHSQASDFETALSTAGISFEVFAPAASPATGLGVDDVVAKAKDVEAVSAKVPTSAKLKVADATAAGITATGDANVTLA